MSEFQILYHHRTLGDGAEGIHVAEMVNAFRLKGHEVDVICPGTGQSAKLKSGESTPGAQRLSRLKQRIPKFLFCLAQLFYNVTSYRRVVRAIKRHKPDFLYERYACFSFGAIKAARRYNVPVIVEFNTPYSLAWAKYDKLHFKWLAKRIEQYVIDSADVLITVSTALKELLVAEGARAEKILVTPNAINPDMLDQVKTGVVRQQLQLRDRLVIGFVGSLRRWHGIDLLMKAVPRILAVYPNCHFLIVGSGELEQEFRDSVQRIGGAERVTFVGRVPHGEVLNYVDAMDVGLMPNSNFYGSPMKVFEYMALGKTTVAPRLGPLEEVITHGTNGWLTEPGDEDSLVDALIHLAAHPDLRKSLGEAARNDILRDHTWQINADKVLAAFEQLGRPAIPQPC